MRASLRVNHDQELGRGESGSSLELIDDKCAYDLKKNVYPLQAGFEPTHYCSLFLQYITFVHSYLYSQFMKQT